MKRFSCVLTRVLLAMVVLATSFFSSSKAALHGTVICSDSTVPPGPVLTWYPSNIPYNICFDSTNVFATDYENSRIHRYALNGENHVVWEEAVTGVVNPVDCQLGPINRHLYVNDGYNFQNLWIFDSQGSGAPIDSFFHGPSSAAPGGHIYGAQVFAISPTTGNVYVLDSGRIVDENDVSTWISRIQRFRPDGTFDGLVINNSLGAPPWEDPPTTLQCGSWHQGYRMYVDHEDNLYLVEWVDNAWTHGALHKFSSSGNCLGVWDLSVPGTGPQNFSVDHDGRFYATDTGMLRRWTAGFGELLYETPLSGETGIPIFAPNRSQFFMLLTKQPLDYRRIEILGPQVEPLRIVEQAWQDTSPPYHLKTDNQSLLCGCDGTMKTMGGAVADGVSSLLIRWEVPGPGAVEWSLKDPNELNNDSLLGTLVSLDSTEINTSSIQVSVIRNSDGRYYAMCQYVSPSNYDRQGLQDFQTLARPVYVDGQYQPLGTPNQYSLQVATAPLNITRPPLMFVHGLWSDSEVWAKMDSAIRSSVNVMTFALDYRGSNSRGLEENLGKNVVHNGVDFARGELTDVVDYIEACQVDVVAHSLGGRDCKLFCVTGLGLHSIKEEGPWPSLIPPTSSSTTSSGARSPKRS